MRRRWLSLDRTDALHCARNRLGYLEAGWAHVEVQVAVEATEGVGREAVRAPEGCSGLTGGTEDVVLNGGSVAVLHIRDADLGCDERCGELRDLVYDEVRPPLLDDVDQVVRTRLQLDSDEELGEDERADLRGRKRGSKISNAAGNRLHGVHGPPDAKRREAVCFRFAGDRFARRERHVMSRFSQGTREWQHRPIVTRQRSAGQERTHRTRLRPEFEPEVHEPSVPQQAARTQPRCRGHA